VLFKNSILSISPQEKEITVTDHKIFASSFQSLKSRSSKIVFKERIDMEASCVVPTDAAQSKKKEMI
jgi:hypothetical protein